LVFSLSVLIPVLLPIPLVFTVILVVSSNRGITQDNHLHMSLRDDPFQPINIILRIPISLRLRSNVKPSMNKTEAETVLWAVSGGLVDKEQHRPLNLASGFVAIAVTEDVGSHGTGDVRDLV
jgi:hypothetical protein